MNQAIHQCLHQFWRRPSLSTPKVSLFTLLFILMLANAAKADNNPWAVSLNTLAGPAVLQDLRDKPMVLSFFFTHCPNACPVQTAKLAKVQRDLPVSVRNASRFVSISIDPERDSLERIEQFANSFNVDKDHWRFGRAVADDALKQLLDELRLIVKTDAEDNIDHQMLVYLVAPGDGVVINRYVGTRFPESQLVQDLINVTYSGG